MSAIETDAAEIPSYAVRFSIPAEIAFDDLCLHVAGDKTVTLNWTVVETICAISGVDVDTVRNRPLLLVFMLTAWLTLLARRGLVAEADATRFRAVLDVMLDVALAELAPLDPDDAPPLMAGVKLIRPGTLH